jgi:hypothetical protein
MGGRGGLSPQRETVWLDGCTHSVVDERTVIECYAKLVRMVRLRQAWMLPSPLDSCFYGQDCTVFCTRQDDRSRMAAWRAWYIRW